MMLDIKNMLDEDKLFNFMSGLQGVLDLPTAMAAADCLVDYKMGGAISTMQKQKLEGGKKTKENLTQRPPPRVNPLQLLNVIHATRLGLKLEEDTSRIKAINSKAHKIQGVAKNILMQVGDWKGMFNLLCVPLDDFNLILGVDFLLKAKVALIPHLGGFVVLEEKKPYLVQALRAKDGGKSH
ncbi:hypothetical protein AAG906_004180 [Vitis piasezkii]